MPKPKPPRGRTRGRPAVNKVRVQLKLDPGINQKLSEAAKKEGVSRSEFAQEAVVEKLKKQMKKR